MKTHIGFTSFTRTNHLWDQPDVTAEIPALLGRISPILQLAASKTDRHRETRSSARLFNHFGRLAWLAVPIRKMKILHTVVVIDFTRDNFRKWAGVNTTGSPYESNRKACSVTKETLYTYAARSNRF